MTPKKNKEEQSIISFYPHVEEIIQTKLEKLKVLLQDPVIVSSVNKFNTKRHQINPGEIYELDEKWRRSSGEDRFVRGFTTNKCALRLLQFRMSHPGFSEIFVTGQKGLNVGQTNKTSDFFQADEGWWIETFNKGKAFRGNIEYDESSQTEAISIYLPVKDPLTKKTVGVAKAVLNLAAIKEEL